MKYNPSKRVLQYVLVLPGFLWGLLDAVVSISVSPEPLAEVPINL